MGNDSKTENKKLGKVTIEIGSANNLADYIQAIGFLLSTIDENHLTERFTERMNSETYVLTQIHNAGRLLQDLAEGLGNRLEEMAQFCHENHKEEL